LHRTGTRSRLLPIALLLSLSVLPAGPARAFSTGSGQCSVGLTAFTHGAAQPGNGGFTLATSASTYGPGDVVQITLDAAAPAAFRGVLLYAFDGAGLHRGTFAYPAGYHDMPSGSCAGDPNGTLTQSDNSVKFTPVTFDWTAPDAGEPLTFVANVVVDMSAFYLLDPVDIVSSATGVPAEAAARAWTLEAAPNPFTDGTTIRFAAPGDAGVSLRVFDVMGRSVRLLADGAHAAQAASVRWDGRGDDGTRVHPGVYFLRLESAGAARTAKVLRTDGAAR